LAIYFHSQGIRFNLNKKLSLKSWIKESILSEKKTPGTINIIFVADDYMHQLNKDFLNHDTYTDIITFTYSTGKILSGDVFISIERVKENSKTYKVDFEEELSRVLIHGILHLCGYKDKSKADKLIMRQKEEKYLSLHPLKK
jgi:probable rRNA maturation factor